jgi:hypothetical protein
MRAITDAIHFHLKMIVFYRGGKKKNTLVVFRFISHTLIINRPVVSYLVRKQVFFGATLASGDRGGHRDGDLRVGDILVSCKMRFGTSEHANWPLIASIMLHT